MSSYRQPGVVLRDHRFSVPLDHANPSGERIELYGREAVAASKADADLPWLVYLEGGPGFGARRFIGKQAWLGRALEEFRVLHLDQRGTGFSTPLNRQTLPALGGPRQQADHLALFRSDNIVRDCEAIRPQLTGGAPWTVLGQSFGGFCAVRYLSTAPEGLRTVLITGGLPSLDAGPDDIYRAAYPRIERKVAAHYARYPQDVERARRIVDHIAEHRPVLPNGYRLTPEAFQSLGILLGTGDGTHQLHQLLDNAFVRTAAGHELSDAFQEKVAASSPSPGTPVRARPRGDLRPGRPPHRLVGRAGTRGVPRFDAERALAGDTPLLFTGETIHPWHFTSDPSLRPLRETAELLAARTDWPALYDRSRLATNEVPVAAPSTTTTCTSTPATRWRRRVPSGGCAPGSPTSTSTTASASRAHGCSTGSSAWHGERSDERGARATRRPPDRNLRT